MTILFAHQKLHWVVLVRKQNIMAVPNCIPELCWNAQTLQLLYGAELWHRWVARVPKFLCLCLDSFKSDWFLVQTLDLFRVSGSHLLWGRKLAATKLALLQAKLPQDPSVLCIQNCLLYLPYHWRVFVVVRLYLPKLLETHRQDYASFLHASFWEQTLSRSWQDWSILLLK